MKQIAKSQKYGNKHLIKNLCLIVFPWLFFLAQGYWYPIVLRQLLGPSIRVSSLLSLAPFLALLLIGIIIAQKQNFPVWSYTWIGTIFFFGYREVFQFVIMQSFKIVPSHAEMVIIGFRLIVVPLAFAFLLSMTARKDWLFACLVAYPYTTVIQAWYTLDKADTPFHVVIVSFILFTIFAYLFLTLQSRVLKFCSLFVGTIVIGVGFYLYQWDILVGGFKSFILVSLRLISIMIFPLIINKIPLYHILFRTQKLPLAENLSET